jgi:hypothetical protein
MTDDNVDRPGDVPSFRRTDRLDGGRHRRRRTTMEAMLTVADRFDVTFIVLDFETLTPPGRPPEPVEVAAVAGRIGPDGQ